MPATFHYLMDFREDVVGLVFPDILHLDYVQREKGWGYISTLCGTGTLS